MRVIEIKLDTLAVKVPVEREQLYERIKALLEKAEHIANTHENEKTRLRAMEVAVKIGQFLAGVLKDAQLEDLQAEVERLESEDED
jgi:predicted regulator of amino acid metabolism with ACT domain